MCDRGGGTFPWGGVIVVRVRVRVLAYIHKRRPNVHSGSDPERVRPVFNRSLVGGARRREAGILMPDYLVNS